MISVIIPSVRDYRWKDIVEGFATTQADHEIIVCGPCPPQDLGPHFRAIQTNVKAAQCAEIAARQSKGEYLFIIQDDLDSTPNILDILLDRRLSYKEELIILSPSFSQLGQKFPPEVNYFPSPTGRCGPNDPLIPTGMFISRKDWDAIGGIDRNFVTGFWDLDIGMRCWSMGGKVIVFLDLFVDEILPDLPHTASLNVNASHHQDMPYLLSLWTDGSVGPTPGTLRTTRSKPFEPFVDEGIMTEDQGPPNVIKAKCQSADAKMIEYIKQIRSTR